MLTSNEYKPYKKAIINALKLLVYMSVTYNGVSAIIPKTLNTSQKKGGRHQKWKRGRKIKRTLTGLVNCVSFWSGTHAAAMVRWGFLSKTVELTRVRGAEWQGSLLLCCPDIPLCCGLPDERQSSGPTGAPKVTFGKQIRQLIQIEIIGLAGLKDAGNGFPDAIDIAQVMNDLPVPIGEAIGQMPVLRHQMSEPPIPFKRILLAIAECHCVFFHRTCCLPGPRSQDRFLRQLFSSQRVRQPSH